MARYETTPAKVAALLGRMDQILTRAALAEQEKSLADAKRELVRKSSGTVKTATLRKMGHPFARRAPQSSPDASVINDQGGAFKKSWQKAAPVVSGDFVVSRVVNTDPKARYMHGTKRMVNRPIIAAVKRYIRPTRNKRARFYLNREIQKEMSQ